MFSSYVESSSAVKMTYAIFMPHSVSFPTKTLKVNDTRMKFKLQKIDIFTRSYLTISHSKIIRRPIKGGFIIANSEKE